MLTFAACAEGPVGPDGAEGPEGPAGATGPQGPAGPQGERAGTDVQACPLQTEEAGNVSRYTNNASVLCLFHAHEAGVRQYKSWRDASQYCKSRNYVGLCSVQQLMRACEQGFDMKQALGTWTSDLVSPTEAAVPLIAPDTFTCDTFPLADTELEYGVGFTCCSEFPIYP
jgi:hypothetical protein